MLNEHFYTITGDPGSGKTSLINELQNRGYRCVAEVARQLIQEQVVEDGAAVPLAIRARDGMAKQKGGPYEQLTREVSSPARIKFL